MTDIVTSSWSEIDASNSQFPPEGWPAGMFPNAVEPTARMNMGALKRFWNRVNPVYMASLSTADSYTFTPTLAITGYGLYERWSLRMPQANASTSPTLLGSALPPQPVKKYVGSSVTVLAAGDIRAKDHEFYWDGLQFILMNPFVAPATGTVVTDIAATTNGGLVFSASFNSVKAGIQPSILPVKSPLTSSDSILIGDAAQSNVPKTGLISALSSVVKPGAPVNSISANYTTQLTDSNAALYHPPSDSTARTVTLAAGVHSVGDILTIENDIAAGVITLTAATADTLVFANGSGGGTGTRAIAAGSMVSVHRVASTRWMLSGSGIT